MASMMATHHFARARRYILLHSMFANIELARGLRTSFSPSVSSLGAGAFNLLPRRHHRATPFTACTADRG
jgi:hypothetical protein